MGNTRRIGYSRQVIRNTITVKGYSSCRCKWFDGAYWTSITGPVLLVPEHCRAGASRFPIDHPASGSRQAHWRICINQKKFSNWKNEETFTDVQRR